MIIIKSSCSKIKNDQIVKTVETGLLTQKATDAKSQIVKLCFAFKICVEFHERFQKNARNSSKAQKRQNNKSKRQLSVRPHLQNGK